MNGNIVLDTNILIYLSKKLIKPEKIFEEGVAYHISVISKMELLGYAFRNRFEEEFLINLINALSVVPLTSIIADATITLRKKTKSNYLMQLFIPLRKYWMVNYLQII
ncbi:hypothetical protein EV200_10846 [Pedobacter psychrotolerans]|uniref:PIN domain-containing protein n=1 Tax=Pedobacter psychrotolerans TaxID=1843235 RepID=A0A4R2H594_9SPHI|nr:hypothetical protein [Pedobacter psychrotolerans]TCO20606.1 hypothetical protein EV200_10846 [Pedobacter psychrotolerans]GGE66779.1 hypothetical protein GCM10011413_36640 [Pedobacter psychrotolerans]